MKRVTRVVSEIANTKRVSTIRRERERERERERKREIASKCEIDRSPYEYKKSGYMVRLMQKDHSNPKMKFKNTIRVSWG